MSPLDPKIGEKLSRTAAEFLSTDIDSALIFIGLARSEHDDSEKKFRNQRNARKAYDKIRELFPRLGLSPEEQSKINQKLSYLKSELQALGEHF